MSNQNLTNKAIPAEVLTQALADLEKIETALKPYLITLTKEERINRSSMGDKSVAFVMKAHESAVNQPQLVPAYVDMDGWAVDIELVDQIKAIATKVASLNEMLSDTRLEAGSEAYNTALLLYASLKEAGRAGVAGAKPIVEDLSKRFPRSKRNNPSTEEK